MPTIGPSFSPQFGTKNRAPQFGAGNQPIYVDEYGRPHPTYAPVTDLPYDGDQKKSGGVFNFFKKIAVGAAAIGTTIFGFKFLKGAQGQALIEKASSVPGIGKVIDFLKTNSIAKGIVSTFDDIIGYGKTAISKVFDLFKGATTASSGTQGATVKEAVTSAAVS